MSERNMEGRIAVVTGGGGFLCSAICKDLAKRGAKVAVLELRLETAQRIVDEIARGGGQALAMAGDVTDVASVMAARELVRATYGRCSLLVNGAGGNQAPAITSTKRSTRRSSTAAAPTSRASSTSIWARLIDVVQVNIMGTVIPCRSSARTWRAAAAGRSSTSRR